MSVTEEIKERLDIIEVISQYVPLKKAGRTYKGLCPFHNEKTPSFVVFPEGQSWHCFGACGTGGDVFSFVMKRENLDFGEALALLAAKAGVELQPRGEVASADEQRLERLRALVADAALYFNYLLNRAAEAAIARDYLAGRGLARETWETWQLGYALDSWDALRERLRGKGYTLAEMDEAGMVIRRDDGSGVYDRFRGRLMIPIRDVQGRAIGFGARILREDSTRPQPKYINSPQTPLFDKGNVLFGLDMAKKAIRDAGLAVLVEGYMDVLMSHQVGVSNVVAGMGTALTEAHIRQLKRYSSNLTLALDPDAAGDHAVLRGLDTARQALEREWQPTFSPTGLVRQESRLKAQLRIATLPDRLDPDELARSDVERWRRVIAEARPVVDYYLALVGQEEDLTSAHGKANAVERMAPLIREIANPVERTHYIQLLARLIQTDERLVAEQVAVARGTEASRPRMAADSGEGVPPMASVSTELPERAATRQPKRAQSPVSAVIGGRGAASGLEEHILGCVLLRSDLLTALDVELIEAQAPPFGPEDLASEESRAVLASVQALASMASGWSPEEVVEALPQALQGPCRSILQQAQQRPPLTDEKLAKDLGDSLLRLRAQHLHQQISQLAYLILDSEEAGAREQLRQYQELMVAYTAQKRQIQQLLNARTMAGALVRSQQATN